VFVWGGDGMVQRCVDELGAPTSRSPSCRPAPPTAGDEPGDPADIATAVQIGLHVAVACSTSQREREHFVVMAGVGFDALMIRDAGKG